MKINQHGRKRKERIAVVGAGRMGRGLSLFFAYAGYPVCLLDAKERNETEREKLFHQIDEELNRHLSVLAHTGLVEQTMVDVILSRITCHGKEEGAQILQSADFVFEAVPEILAVKEHLLGWIGENVSKDAVMASTTSSFQVDTLAQFVAEPARFINTHWLNPAYLIPLVEVSAGRSTGADTTRRMVDMLQEAGKIPVTCAPSPGFIVPRLQALAMNEAARLVEEGVASVEAIDTAVKVGFGIRFAVLGLLEFIDWGGADILYHVDNYLVTALANDRFKAPAILEEKMKSGEMGMRSGKGFYDFSAMDLAAYQKETISKFIDLLIHLQLIKPPFGQEQMSKK